MTTHSPTTVPAVVELRQYRLQPGRREALIELFEREFIETQEAAGIQLIGQFRDLDDPDRFVWLRGFANMPMRAQALQAFYGGAAWQAHRDAANATMIDSDDVLLLRPAYPHSGSAAAASVPGNGGLVVATICHFDDGVDPDFLDFFAQRLAPALAEAGAPVLANWMTETTPNNFPALPVREGAHVFVWLARFADEVAHRRHLAKLVMSEHWWEHLASALARYLARAPQFLRLAPTTHSRLR